MAQISAYYCSRLDNVDQAHVEARTKIETYMRTVRNNYSPLTRIDVKLNDEVRLLRLNDGDIDGEGLAHYGCRIEVRGWFEPDAFIQLGFDFEAGMEG